MKLWMIEQSSYEPLKNRMYETLFTLANGYRGIRGNHEFSNIGQVGNFISGIYDKASEDVPEIVNGPNPLGLNIYIENKRIALDDYEIVDFNRFLDMQRGILSFTFIVKLDEEKMLKVESERFVSRHNVHRWAANYKIQPLNFSGSFDIESYIDGTTVNKAFDDKNRLKHYKVEVLDDLINGLYLQAATIDTSIKLVEITSLKLPEKYGRSAVRSFYSDKEQVKEKFKIYLESGEEYCFYKYGVTYTDRDCKEDVHSEAKENFNTFLNKGYEKELKDHVNTWLKIWENIDIQIEGDTLAQKALRFNLFQLASSAYGDDTRVSIGAKALHGEGYKGHIFWDTEIFMLPFFIYTQPEVAKALLMYRYNALPEAKKKAKENGFEGAQYPWESADTGEEVTPIWGVNFDGSIIKIYTGEEEFHINSDIVYAIIQYYKASGDEGFLVSYGLEMIFETTKFWKSRVQHNTADDRYEINNVIGPDEFHEHVNNNVYTNYLAKWNIKIALELAQWIKSKDKRIFDKLCLKVGVTEEELENWKVIERKIYIPKGKDGRLIEQFEGYFDLQDIHIKELDSNGMPLWPENIEIKDLFKTQLVKQADLVMLLYLLSEEFDYETKKINYEYYEKRTMHKSSLSPSIYSILGLQVGDTKNAYNYFMKTVLTDLEDNQGNTSEGLHAAATGGAWQSVIFGFAGMRIEKDGIVSFNPWLPPQWDSLSFNIKSNGSNLKLVIEKKRIVITSEVERIIKVKDDRYHLNPGETIAIC